MKLLTRPTDIKTEILAGATTFLAMAYILFVHPEMLANTGMDKDALIAVTCIAAAIGTILVGLFADSPIAMAPGMGLNSYFTYSVVLGEKVPWPTALGIVFISGLVFFLLTAVGIRKKLVEAIPKSLIFGIAVGIGMFITFMGLVDIGVIVKNDATLVSAGALTGPVLIGLTVLMIMVILQQLKIRGSLIIGIFVGTILALVCGYVKPPAEFVSLDIDLSPIAFQLDILGALKGSLFGTIFAMMFIDMFDSIGTVIACCHKAGLVDKDGHIRRIDRLLGIDALATMIGAALGTSTTTAYIESGAGIEQGGRTGLTAIVTGALFLLSLAFIPVIGMVPKFATGPALVMVGLFMMAEVVKIDFKKLDEAFPAFVIIVMIALSYSISRGLAFGFIAYVMLKVVSRRFSDIKPAMWLIALLSILFFVV